MSNGRNITFKTTLKNISNKLQKEPQMIKFPSFFLEH